MSRDELNKALWSLPHGERLAMLTCSIVEQNPGAVFAIKAIIAVASHMARQLTVEQRYMLAENLRDEADKLERRQSVPIT